MGDTKDFHADMMIGEAIRRHPRVTEVLMSFHLGGCSHCGISEEETIGQVCYGYGIETHVLIDALNGLVEGEVSETKPDEAPTPSS